MALSLPWALAKVAAGSELVQLDAIQEWWEPVRALQPGIAEEAWGRAFMIPFLLLVFGRSAPAGVALWTAVLVAAAWFAWLHLPLNPVATVLLGLLFVLPMAMLWLRRDLESEMGFHVASDLVRLLGSNRDKSDRAGSARQLSGVQLPFGVTCTIGICQLCRRFAELAPLCGAAIQLFPYRRTGSSGEVGFCSRSWSSRRARG